MLGSELNSTLENWWFSRSTLDLNLQKISFAYKHMNHKYRQNSRCFLLIFKNIRQISCQLSNHDNSIASLSNRNNLTDPSQQSVELDCRFKVFKCYQFSNANKFLQQINWVTEVIWNHMQFQSAFQNIFISYQFAVITQKFVSLFGRLAWVRTI